MILTGTLSPKEEGANITMNCTMKADPQKCRDLVNGLANSTQLYTSKSSTTSDTTDDKVIEHIKRIYMVRSFKLYKQITLTVNATGGSEVKFFMLIFSRTSLTFLHTFFPFSKRRFYSRDITITI